MSYNIGGFGLNITLIASMTFPNGINLSQFVDDADPVDNPNVKIGEAMAGLNGDLIHWHKANVITITVNLIPDSEDDNNLKVLASANRAGAGRQLVNDNCTMVVTYPDGSTAAFYNGFLIEAPLISSVASSGRMKSKMYQFAFENVD